MLYENFVWYKEISPIFWIFAAVIFALYLLPFLFFHHSSSTIPPFSYAQGYYAHTPGIGVTRIIPLAGNMLKSPAADSAGDEDFLPNSAREE